MNRYHLEFFDCPRCGDPIPLSVKAVRFSNHLLAVVGEGILNSHHRGRKYVIPTTKVLCPMQFEVS